MRLVVEGNCYPLSNDLSFPMHRYVCAHAFSAESPSCVCQLGSNDGSWIAERVHCSAQGPLFCESMSGCKILHFIQIVTIQHSQNPKPLSTCATLNPKPYTINPEP